jgi:hypothetical protein
VAAVVLAIDSASLACLLAVVASLVAFLMRAIGLAPWAGMALQSARITARATV